MKKFILLIYLFSQINLNASEFNESRIESIKKLASKVSCFLTTKTLSIINLITTNKYLKIFFCSPDNIKEQVDKLLLIVHKENGDIYVFKAKLNELKYSNSIEDLIYNEPNIPNPSNEFYMLFNKSYYRLFNKEISLKFPEIESIKNNDVYIFKFPDEKIVAFKFKENLQKLEGRIIPYGISAPYNFYYDFNGKGYTSTSCGRK